MKTPGNSVCFSQLSNFAHTFYMYLLHEKNIGATADAMNMHRSSLTYRLKKSMLWWAKILK